MPEGPLPEKLSTIMAPLEKVKEQTVILGGMWSQLRRTSRRHDGFGSLGGGRLHDREQAEEDDGIRLHRL